MKLRVFFRHTIFLFTFLFQVAREALVASKAAYLSQGTMVIIIIVVDGEGGGGEPPPCGKI